MSSIEPSAPAPEPQPVNPAPINLSETQSLLRTHSGLDALPGYVVVVFEKLEHGGAKFAKLVNSDERFKRFFLPFISSPDEYFAVAVNQSVLSYQFEAAAKLDNDIREFTLIFNLTYRATDSRKLAELKSQDPLDRLTQKIANTIKRSCALRKWDMVKERFRELERIVLASDRPGLDQYAGSLGLEIISLELDRRLPAEAVVIEETRLKVDTSIKKHELLKTEELEMARTTTSVEEQKNIFRDRAAHARQDELRKRDQKIELDSLNQKFDVEDRTLDRQIQLQDRLNLLHQEAQNRKLNEMKTDAIGTAIKNVGEGINTPAALQDGFNVAQEMSRQWRSDNGTALQNGLPGAAAPLGLPAKEDALHSILVQGLGEIGSWHYPDAQQRALRSAILHIIAEALLSEDAEAEVMKKYADKLDQLGRDLHPPLTGTQFRLLKKFKDVEALRTLLG